MLRLVESAQLYTAQQATAAIKPITTPGAMAAAPEF
jgi:hypothetical protein